MAPYSGHSGESLVNNPSATITRPSAEFVSLNQENENDYFLNDFDLSYLDSGNYTPNSPSLVGVDPQVAFKDAFECSQNTGGTEKIDSVDEWNIPQLGPEEVTGPKNRDWFGQSC